MQIRLVNPRCPGIGNKTRCANMLEIIGEDKDCTTKKQARPGLEGRLCRSEGMEREGTRGTPESPLHIKAPQENLNLKCNMPKIKGNSAVFPAMSLR